MRELVLIVALTFAAILACIVAVSLSSETLALLLGLGVGGALILGTAREVIRLQHSAPRRPDYNERQLPAPRPDVHVVQPDRWAHHDEPRGYLLDGRGLPAPWPAEATHQLQNSEREGRQ